MKQVIIIAITVVCTVVGVLVIQFFINSGDEKIGFMAYDCAKGWPDVKSFKDKISQLENLTDEQIENLTEEMRNTSGPFFKNNCISTVDYWGKRTQDNVTIPLILDDMQFRQQWLDLEWNWNQKYP